MEVRTAVLSDATEIAELFEQLGYPSTAESMAQRLPLRLADPNIDVLVAFNDVMLTGVLVLNVFFPLHVRRPWAVISALVVDQSQRSGGVGAALLARAEQAAHERGCGHMELACSERRTSAHDFYVRHGFEEVRKRFLKRYS